MAFRLYIVPAIGTGTRFDPRRPKYISVLGVPLAAMDYGFNPVFLVAADLSSADDAAVVANADVFAFPFDLDTSITGGAINQTKNALEARLIPAQFVAGGMLYRDLARVVAGMFQFMQRLNVVLGNEVVIDTAEKLNILWSNVPANYQVAILEAATSLGYDTAFITDSTQLRAILKVFADGWGSKPFVLNQFVF